VWLKINEIKDLQRFQARKQPTYGTAMARHDAVFSGGEHGAAFKLGQSSR
jgi:hypothetical protein